jgi:hypothetical protein
MSLPQFSKKPIPLPVGHGGGQSQTFSLSGLLGDDEEKRIVYLYVMIQQTSEDRGEPASDPPAIAIAKGRDQKTVPAKSTTTMWQAKITVPVGQTQFGPGFATGTALTVEYSNDPVGFETYIWTQRLELKG